ncbi:hypothetical protein ADK86_05980 [Streptomyces sp. NRRL F-5755]|nr:hypothetical protein ADK86_05980 [Streptomyces sp. NRRL F-5755]
MAGETYSRWIWCQKHQMGVVYAWVDGDGRAHDLGTAAMKLHTVTVGNGQARGVRTYIQVQSVTYDPEFSLDPEIAVRIMQWEQEVSKLKSYILAECVQTSTYCQSSPGAVEHSWKEWDSRPTQEWLFWDTHSREEASSADDKVLFHQWHLRIGGSGGAYTYRPGVSADRTIRCDSATYFSLFGVPYNKACINYDVVPHLQYKISDSRVTSVARHIRHAQNDPGNTYPAIGYKVIPGKYTGKWDNLGLTRVLGGSATHQNNVAEKDRACKRLPPYETNGLPEAPKPGEDCDEYPFATTEQGAASPYWDFSVRAVPSSENQSAGGLLGWYYFRDRILTAQDPFWVDIQD